MQQLARAFPAHLHKRDCHRAVHAFEIHINKFRQRKKVSEGQKPKNSQNRKRAKQSLEFSPCPRSCLRIWSRETVSTVPSRVSLLISILRLNLVLTYGIPPEFRGGVHVFI